MDQNLMIDLEEMEAMTYSILDFDMLMENWQSNIIDSSFYPNDTPAEEWGPQWGPQQPQTKCLVPLGAAPLSLEQPVLPAPEFLAAQTDFPLLPLSDALAEVGLGPQQPETECYMLLGAAPLSLEQLVLPAPGYHAAQTDFPLLPLYDALAEGELGPQQPETEWYMSLGAAPLSLEQPVLPAPEFLAAKTDFPLLPLSDALAEVGLGPQQPQTECLMPLGAAPLSPEQPVLPAPGYHAAQTDLPPLPPYYAPAEERVGPQQPQTDRYMPLGAAPFSLQHPVLPAPGHAPPMYQPPTVLQQNCMYYQGTPFRHSQVNNGHVVSLLQGRGVDLTPIGYINGEIFYAITGYSAPPVASDVSVINSNTPRKKRCYTKSHDESQPYIKRPPNSFMIFRMEQRPLVVAELRNSECATVNKVIGQRWKSMSKEEQARYYEYAEKEKQIHLQLYPEWSTRDNYGKKRKRIRRKGPSTTEDCVI